MQSLQVFVQIFLLVTVFNAVASIPVPLSLDIPESRYPNEKNKRHLHDIADEANRMISSALQVLNKLDSHPKATTMLATAFGLDYNTKLSNIKSNYEALATYKLQIMDEHGKMPAGFEGLKDKLSDTVWLAAEQKLVILDKFYTRRYHQATPFVGSSSNGLDRQAGLLISDAVVAALKTTHFFDKATFRNGWSSQPLYDGRLDRDFATLREKGKAAVLLRNPDSYWLFAHFATHGFPSTIAGVPDYQWKLPEGTAPHLHPPPANPKESEPKKSEPEKSRGKAFKDFFKLGSKSKP